MDTSKEYVKMCQLATEIQKDDFDIKDFKHDISDGNMIYPKYVWLPRQDQLQDMLKYKVHKHFLAYKFALWCHGGQEFGKIIPAHNTGVDGDNSMEQLWLAFVMKENYDKKWNGKDWE